VKNLGIHRFQECVVSDFECTLQKKYKFSANRFPVSRKDLGINVTSVLVIQAQVFFIFVTGLKTIRVEHDPEFY